MADPLTVGKLEVQDASGKTVMRIDPSKPPAKLEILNFDQVVATLGNEIKAGVAFRVTNKGTSVHYLHCSGLVNFGGTGSNGNLNLVGSKSKRRIRLDADGGEVMLFPFMAGTNPESSEHATIHLGADQARIRAGGNGRDGNVVVRNAKGATVINLDGEKGDILLENADCAEEFDVEDPTLEPGSVLVLSDEPGRLRVSDAPYDTRVAGILSGAGDYRPAIVLDRKPEREGRRPIALVGKVWCKVEADSAPIGVGTLLTTSSLPGRAMAATDRERAFGAVLGKALAPLAAGVGMVPVLVGLQ